MITLPAMGVSARPKNPPAQLIRHENRQPDGTYVLTADDPRSIQAYYQDVGVGPLILPTRMEWEDMRETCLALGEYWRPLGHVLIPGSRHGKSLFDFTHRQYRYGCSVNHFMKRGIK